MALTRYRVPGVEPEGILAVKIPSVVETTVSMFVGEVKLPF
jgi:hypothetical protein